VSVRLSAFFQKRYTSPEPMPKRPKQALPSPLKPVQLPLIPDTASLVRIKPEKNEWRYYRMEVWPDLFGRAMLVRQWGRIGTAGRRRLDPHRDPGAAVDALMTLLRSKRKRGYVDRSV
jgi:predicted DNA-binding WGR domain protein